MNNVNRNKVNNYIYLYNIPDNEENVKKFAEVVKKREYTIYHQILYIIDNCRIIEDSSSITVEHGKLLEDITKIKTKNKKTGYKKSWRKISACLRGWKSIFNTENLQWFLINHGYVEQHLN